MYNDDVLKAPESEAHFWEMVEANFEFARHVLEDYPLETREDAIYGVDENGSPRTEAMEVIAYRKNSVQVIAYRNTSEDYEQRQYCYDLGRAVLPIVRRMIDSRELTQAFVHEWGKLQFCHGYLASLVFDDSDGMAQNRGAAKRAAEMSVDDKRAWVARILARETAAGRMRKEAERVVEDLAKQFRDAGGYGPGYPPDWFADLLKDNGTLKSTYGKGQMPGTSLEARANCVEQELPPLEFHEVQSGPR
ncbi:hypothetical protein GGR25_004434 [Kaistia hirudinis]|uniref:Uncharacterized protein n=1 Tax=Kaistia hirudinis TaxID=1293440 RepID=A0A840AX48_9HYPH|nr:hypothetical protein [Kaistia hirudinis]MBB3933361.1 hypothetical protein [Kaistia hirudinis]